MISEEKKTALIREAQRWHGTPFREHTEICGVGADCVHLARGVAVGAGFDVPPINNNDYPLDWAMHRSRSLVLEWVEGTKRFRKLADGEPPQPGDLICIRQGRCSHHVALMIDGRQFLHTAPGRFAEYGLVDDPQHSGKLAAIYRLLEAEQN